MMFAQPTRSVVDPQIIARVFDVTRALAGEGPAVDKARPLQGAAQGIARALIRAANASSIRTARAINGSAFLTCIAAAIASVTSAYALERLSSAFGVPHWAPSTPLCVIGFVIALVGLAAHVRGAHRRRQHTAAVFARHLLGAGAEPEAAIDVATYIAGAEPLLSGESDDNSAAVVMARLTELQLNAASAVTPIAAALAAAMVGFAFFNGYSIFFARAALSWP